MPVSLLQPQYEIVSSPAEAVRNLEVLLEQAHRTKPKLPQGHPSDLSMLKLYIRPGVGIEPLQAMLNGLLGAQTPCPLLDGEICRRYLLLELEGLYAACAHPQ